MVCGDVGADELGITPDMKKKLIAEVSIVFHGAATLNLDASLSEAVNLNTTGTLRMLEFCSEMKNLEVQLLNYSHFEYIVCVTVVLYSRNTIVHGQGIRNIRVHMQVSCRG